MDREATRQLFDCQSRGLLPLRLKGGTKWVASISKIVGREGRERYRERLIVSGYQMNRHRIGALGAILKVGQWVALGR